ncbi:MAG: hypothetical protein Fur007_22370 [Rhodoferax sp.]
MNFKSLMTTVALAATTLTAFAHGEAVEVDHAWVRATVKGQMATGAFMTLKSDHGGKLVGAASPVAGVVQVHEMKMDAGVMKMAEVQGGLQLPADKAVELKPGGFHIMLMDLKAPLTAGSTVPLTLVVKDDKGIESKVDVQVPVAAKAPMGAAHEAPLDHAAHGAQHGASHAK